MERQSMAWAMKAVLFACAIAILASFGIALSGCSQQDEETVPANAIFDYVVDLGVVEDIDFDAVESSLSKRYDNWEAGGCTAVAKKFDDGNVVVARNLDLSLSNKPAYIVRTNLEGMHKAIGVSYSTTFGQDYEDVLENGVKKSERQTVPFIASDYVNDKGLYCEINMRTDEYEEDGTSRFGCSGTNPEAKKRVCSANLPFYVSQNCATVEEAIDYMNNLDIYTMQNDFMNWNFCMMMADATGRYGVMEIACNKLVWHESAPAQANFYITNEFREKEDFGAGLGRYDTVISGLDYVETEGDLWTLINKVTYFQTFFDQEDQQFDVRTEFVNAQKDYKELEGIWTTDFCLDPKNADKVWAHQRAVSDRVQKMSTQDIRDDGTYWVSAITVQGSPVEKNLKLRFFENDLSTTVLGFDF